MKKGISLILALALTLSMIGCGGNKPGPDTAVTGFCDAVKAFDFVTASGYLEENSDDWQDTYDNEQLEEEFGSAAIVTYLKDCASKMSYEIGEIEENGEEATVPVTFTYVDSDEVIKAVIDEYLVQALALAFSGAEDEEIEALLDTVFEEQAQSVEAGTATMDLAFNCVKVDGEWKIAAFSEDDESKFANLIASNMIDAMENYEPDYGFDDSEYDDSEYDDSDYEYDDSDYNDFWEEDDYDDSYFLDE